MRFFIGSFQTEQCKISMNVVITELIKDRETGRRHVKLQKNRSNIIENKKQ